VPDALPVVAVCRVGQRSQAAAHALAARGLVVANLTGGMLAWQAAGLPVLGEIV
jgi:rhodanese-related sulfurtransferase